MGPWDDLRPPSPAEPVASTLASGEAEVLVLGAGVAGLCAACQLARAGCRVALIETCADSPSSRDLGVLWPGLAEHWSVLEGALGTEQTEALLRLVRASAGVLQASPGWADSDGEGGAVLQLAAQAPEWAEMTTRLDWLSERWPRRLMSSGAASNYLSLGQFAGAAFVADCLRFDPVRLRRHWLSALTAAGGVRAGVHSIRGVGEGPGGVRVDTDGGRWQGDILIVAAGHRSLQLAGWERRWLFPLKGAGFAYQDRFQEPWNRALAGLEAYRGHWYSRPHPRWGRLVQGLSPAAGWEAMSEDDSVDAGLVARLVGLSRALLPGLPEAAPDRVWSVVFSYSADGLPLVGPLPGSARTWISAGFGTRSWSLGPALGAALAEEILGRSETWLRAVPALRPSRLLG